MQKITLSFLLLSLYCFNSVHAGNITVQVTSPANNGLSGDILTISASVQSIYQISTVTAAVNGRSTTLNYDGTTARGTINLVGLSKGVSLQLIINANDVFNTQQSDTVNFIYAPKPVIDIISPLKNSNLYPSLTIKASCSAVGNSDLKVSLYFGKSLQGNPYFQKDYSNGIVDTTFQLPHIDSNAIINFLATDNFGQKTSVNYLLFFDTSPFLTEVYKANDSIADFNYGKLLTINDDVNIEDVSTGSKTNVPMDASGLIANYYSTPKSILTPYGAIFFDGKSIYNDWNNGSIYTFGTSQTSPYVNNYSLNVAGKWATWEQYSGVYPDFNPDLYLRDLSTKQDISIASNNQGSEDNCVAANGFVDYVFDGVYLDGMTFAMHPLTDGNHVVFLKRDYNALIMYNNGHSNDTLSDISSFYPEYPEQSPQPGINYQINNGFVAYSKTGTTQMQIWLRDSSGTRSQVTYFNTTSIIELLNPNGDIMLINNGERYLAKKGILQPIDLGPATGKVYYRDSTWYLTEGVHLYKLLVNAYVAISNGNWNAPSTWRDNIVPPANADVIINNYQITVTTNTSCNSLKVISPGSVTVLPGVNLTVLH